MVHLLTSLGRVLRRLRPCPRLYACRRGRRRASGPRGGPGGAPGCQAKAVPPGRD